jgi:8-oxo-dGTP pyrophosphatase MutT (NUDIX family)
MRTVEKVYSYINQRERLLVFRHVDFPEAGIQVPGGTMDAGETPEAAVLREAGEETGLGDLVVKAFLGRDEFLDSSTNPGKILVRHFFHLGSPHEIPETWQHYENDPSDGSPGPILFEFYWLPVGVAADKLDPYFAAMLARLPEKKDQRLKTMLFGEDKENNG